MLAAMIAGSVGVTALVTTGCGPPATEARFDSANPAAKLYAIEKAARSGDTSALPQLVEQLDSDDPAVRLLAIEALRRLTGEDYGYAHDDPPPLRRAAIKRWVAALEPSAQQRVADSTGGLRYEQP